MKRLVTLLFAVLMTATLAGCSLSDIFPGESGAAGADAKDSVVTPDEDGYAEGRMGSTMRTYFFDYTVNSAFVCSEYEGYTPAEGNELLVVDMTVKNTFHESLSMFDTDFQAQWNDSAEDAYSYPVENGDGISTKILPGEYTLNVDESRSGQLFFEVPAGHKDFSISYMEFFDDNSTGDTFFVFFTADQK